MQLHQVIVRLEGGLGNQLFQYAAARALADRLKCDLVFDLRGLIANGDRAFQLDLYKVRAEVASADLLERLPDPRSRRSGRIRMGISQRFPSLYTYPLFWPKSFAYDARFDNIKRPPYLVGYWQSERYFLWNRNRIIADLQLRSPQIATPLSRRIIQSESVALHVRRGDYVSNSLAAQFHGLCDVQYYRRAIEALQKSSDPIEVYVFSDEPDWARNNLDIGVPFQVVDIHGPSQGYLDMELMSLCKHHVIANSSFSWWGAWRSQRNGQVCAPRRWFADTGVDTSDVIPKMWTSM